MIKKQGNHDRLVIEDEHKNRNTAEKYDMYAVKHEFGLFYNEDSGEVDQPVVQTYVRYYFESGRIVSKCCAADMTPEQCRELAKFLNKMASDAENAA